MITAIRRMFSSTIGKFLALAFVGLVGVAFALSDVTGNSTFGGIGGANVAKVGSEEIGLGELRDRVRLAYNQARQDQPTLTMAAFVESGGIDQVLNQLIEGMAFEQLASDMGLGVSKRLIDGRIADIPAFAGVSGSFDQTRFQSFLRENGLTEAQLRRDLRQQLLLEQLAAPIASMPRLATGMAQPYAALLLEQRRGQATFIPASPFAPTTDPGDAALQAHLSQNRGKFTIPERRVIQYALFDAASAPVSPRRRPLPRSGPTCWPTGGKRRDKESPATRRAPSQRPWKAGKALARRSPPRVRTSGASRPSAGAAASWARMASRCRPKWPCCFQWRRTASRRSKFRVTAAGW